MTMMDNCGADKTESDNRCLETLFGTKHCRVNREI